MIDFWKRKPLIWIGVALGVLLVALQGWRWVQFEAAVWQAGAGNAALNERLTMDPIGNTLAIIALVSMVCVVLLTVYRLHTQATIPVTGWWAIPLLSMIGLGIMLYLSSIPETTICYPSGACQIIQQSEYGEILNVPVGIWGALGYFAILATWSASLIGSFRLLQIIPWVLLALTLLGVLFSLYFTFLEPFVIGATCPWCLTSAILMTILFWLSAETVQSLRLEQALYG
ncbi:vitamin K epoxide reductase family protein [Candidatus Leptofilum sp.]|uniref:vitamin K epoxide reductase family protein n=1 Tax=Candidatus Leptofilum sp. TaxID=3241576 RepID=UPI003B59AC19